MKYSNMFKESYLYPVSTKTEDIKVTSFIGSRLIGNNLNDSVAHQMSDTDIKTKFFN